MVACVILAAGVSAVCAGTIADYLAGMTAYLNQAGTVAELAADGELSRSVAVSQLASLAEAAQNCFYKAAISAVNTGQDAKILYSACV